MRLLADQEQRGLLPDRDGQAERQPPDDGDDDDDVEDLAGDLRKSSRQIGRPSAGTRNNCPKIAARSPIRKISLGNMKP